MMQLKRVLKSSRKEAEKKKILLIRRVAKIVGVGSVFRDEAPL